MGELGARLRETRESQGISLEQAEKTTRIRRAFLQALEEERFDALPGDVYVRGFLRNYSVFLGLNPDELLTLYRRTIGAPAAAIPQVLDEPLVPRLGTNRLAGVVIGLLALVIVLLVGWYVYNRFYLGKEPWPFASISPLPTAPATHVVTTETPPPSTVSIEPTMTATLPPTSAPVTATMLPTSSPTSAGSPTSALASATPTPTETVTATPTETSGIRVEASVLAKTYLEVTVDGSQVYVGILERGQDQVWTAQRALRLRVGNAAGLKLVVNGIEVAPLGNPGEVIEVEYTLDTLPKP